MNVKITHPSGKSITIQYDSRKAAVKFVGMSLYDNGYVKTKGDAHTAARGILHGPVEVAGARYEEVPGW